MTREINNLTANILSNIPALDMQELEQLWKQARQALMAIDPTKLQTRVNFLLAFESLNTKIECIMRSLSSSGLEQLMSGDNDGTIYTELANAFGLITVKQDCTARAVSRIIIALADRQEAFATSLPIFVESALVMPNNNKLADYDSERGDYSNNHMDDDAIELYKKHPVTKLFQHEKDLLKEKTKLKNALEALAESTIVYKEMQARLTIVKSQLKVLEYLNTHPQKNALIDSWEQIQELLNRISKNDKKVQKLLLIEFYKFNQLLFIANPKVKDYRQNGEDLVLFFRVLGDIFGRIRFNLDNSKILRKLKNNLEYPIYNSVLMENLQHKFDVKFNKLLSYLPANFNRFIDESMLISDEEGLLAANIHDDEQIAERRRAFLDDMEAIDSVYDSKNKQLKEPELIQAVANAYKEDAPKLAVKKINDLIKKVAKIFINDLSEEQRRFIVKLDEQLKQLSIKNTVAEHKLANLQDWLEEADSEVNKLSSAESSNLSSAQTLSPLLERLNRLPRNLSSYLEHRKALLQKIAEASSNPEANKEEKQFLNQLKQQLKNISIELVIQQQKAIELRYWLERCNDQCNQLIEPSAENIKTAQNMKYLTTEGVKFLTNSSFYQRHKVAIWVVGILLATATVAAIASGEILLLGVAKIAAIIGVGAAVTAIAAAKPILITSALIAVGAGAVSILTGVTYAFRKIIEFIGCGIKTLLSNAKGNTEPMSVVELPKASIVELIEMQPISHCLSMNSPVVQLVNQFNLLVANESQAKAAIVSELDSIMYNSELNETQKYNQVRLILDSNISTLPQKFLAILAKAPKIERAGINDVDMSLRVSNML